MKCYSTTTGFSESGDGPLLEIFSVAIRERKHRAAITAPQKSSTEQNQQLPRISPTLPSFPCLTLILSKNMITGNAVPKNISPDTPASPHSRNTTHPSHAARPFTLTTPAHAPSLRAKNCFLPNEPARCMKIKDRVPNSCFPHTPFTRFLAAFHPRGSPKTPQKYTRFGAHRRRPPISSRR